MYNHKAQNTLLELFSKYSDISPHPVDEALVDYFGCVTPIACIPHLQSWAGRVIKHPPLPDDSFRATAIEYQSIIESIEDCGTDNFVFLELGASYAPFCVVAAQLAKRKKSIKRVHLRAVEAAKNGIKVIESNFKANHLHDRIDVDYKILNAALGSRIGTVFFPDVDCTVDNGAGVSADGRVDIRGVAIGLMSVELIPLDYVIDSLQIEKVHIDLAHFDLQGSEGDVLTSSLGLLNKYCKRVLIGTHSRSLEGYLFELFDKNGWILLGEEPCQFEPMENRSICGMTTKDGNLYFLNKRYAARP